MTAPIPAIDRFAEQLSHHGHVHQAAREIGISPSYGRVLLQRIIGKLGRDQCR